ncbi:MAG: lamin tail domain-containing protein [Ferruginibacter sp.]
MKHKVYLFFLLLIAAINVNAQFSQYSVVIDEIMADPTPQVGLPNSEWVELKNTTTTSINLQGWRISKASGQSGPMPSFILKADSFVIVCTSSAVAGLIPFGPVISVTSFPTLSNAGDLLYLRGPDGKIIHSVNYTDAWYKNELKKDGGWTLEMIDTKNPCSGISNWAASKDPIGGTPGRKNSIDAINPDQVAPKIISAYAADSLNIVLVFDEPVDSANGANASNYKISDGIGSSVTALPLSILFDRVALRLSTPLLRNKIYTVTVSNVKDCSGNTINASFNVTRVGLPERTDSLDIVINEILFNPRPDGTDYVELYNRSTKILNLKNVYIANRGTNGAIGSISQLSVADRLLFPGEFVVITEDVEAIKRNFITLNPFAFIELSSLPSYNDDNGSVIILDEQGRIIDEVDYKEKWHFKLISNNEGVALERIDYNGVSNDPDNWHSAAASVNYGTPTYKNSQYRVDAEIKGEISLSPEVFSPDNDGMDDFATINYNFPSAGFVANITIFDAAGRPVKYLKRNALSGIRGSYQWDGLDQNNRKLPVGLYIIYTEIFNLEGKTKKFKHSVVLARKQ